MLRTRLTVLILFIILAGAIIYEAWAAWPVVAQSAGQTTRVSVASDGTEGDGETVSERPTISDDGRYVAFASFASNLVPDDTNSLSDIFVRDREGTPPPSP